MTVTKHTPAPDVRELFKRHFNQTTVHVVRHTRLVTTTTSLWSPIARTRGRSVGRPQTPHQVTPRSFAASRRL